MSRQRWHVRGGGQKVELDPDLHDGMAWEWIVGAEGRERRIVVCVSRTGWASEGGVLPDNLLDAIVAKGRWAVDRHLHWREPPGRIQITTEGLIPTGGAEE